MTGLDRLEWTSIVPFVFWWWYPLGSNSFFEGIAFMMRQMDKERMRKERRMGNLQRENRKPSARRGMFVMYKYLKTSIVWKPPPWVFMIVWMVLYFLIGFSSWMYANWAADERPIFDAQFGLLWANFFANVLWFPLFFIFQRPILAYIDIWIVLVTAVAASVLRFVDYADKMGDPPVVLVSAILFVFYPVWVIYATALSTDILLTMWGQDYSQLGRRKKIKRVYT